MNKAQQIKIITEGTKTSIRGLSVVDDKIFWASGSNGMVARTTDGGKTIEWQQVKGYEKRDFRDVEAFDSNTALIMGVDWPALILKTKDGGKNWYTVFEDSTKGMFLDAMDFDGGYTTKEIRHYPSNQHPQIVIRDIGDTFGKIYEPHSCSTGIVIGDPINGKPFIAISGDDGETWDRFDKDEEMQKLITPFSNGEAFFASSGTNIKLTKFNDWSPPYFVSGGTHSRLIDFYFQHPLPLPILQGKESTGANSIDINAKTKKGIVVGGDFVNDKDTTQNCILIDFTKDISFSHPQTPPHGYRSCVIYLDEHHLVTCGTSGIDISKDGGNHWQLISNESFHVVQKAKNGNAVFLAGGKGRIAQLFFKPR